MRVMLYMICALLTVAVARVDADEPISRNQPQLQEFTVSLQDLYSDGEELFVNINGSRYVVCALQKTGTQWRAQLDSGRDKGYCQRGHDLCSLCGLCHKVGCWYYVEPCWKK